MENFTNFNYFGKSGIFRREEFLRFLNEEQRQKFSPKKSCKTKIGQNRIWELLIEMPILNPRNLKSSNDFCKDMLAEMGEQPPDLALIVADLQSHGRGRRGAKWLQLNDADVEASLLFSLLVEKSLLSWRRKDEARLSQLAAWALCSACHDLGGTDLMIKWPNDVVSPRGKLAGILIESCPNDKRDFFIVGIGVNLRGDLAREILPKVDAEFLPTNLTAEAPTLDNVDESFLREVLLAKFLTNFFAVKDKFLNAEFYQNLQLYDYLEGKRIRLEFADASSISGECLGIQANGGIAILTADGKRKTFWDAQKTRVL